MFYFALRVFFALFFGLGKILSSAGTNLFGSQKILEYFPNHPSSLDIPLKATAFISNTHTTFFAKFFNILLFFTRTKKENVYKRLLDLSRKQKIALITLVAIGYAYGAFSGLPSYIIGTTIYDFLVGKKPEENPEDISWLARGLANYILFSNIFSNYSFNLKNIKRNTEKIIKSFDNIYQNPKQFFDRYLLLTILLSILGVRAYISYTYFATYQSLLNIPLIQKIFRWTNTTDYIDPFAKSIAILAAILSLPSNIMSLVARVYYLFNQQAAPKAAREIGIDSKALYYWTLFVGLIDAAIQGSGSFVSVIMTSKDWFGADTQATLAIIDASLCAASSAFLYACFNVQEAANFFRPANKIEQDVTPRGNIMATLPSYGTFTLFSKKKALAGPATGADPKTSRLNIQFGPK